MKVVILENPEAVAAYGTEMFKSQLKSKPDSVLGLATGSTPLALYQQLISANKNREISFKEVSTFNLDEYLGLAGDHPQSYRHFMNDNLFRHIDINIDNTHVPDGAAEDPLSAGNNYEQLIKAKGGIDIQLLGIGRNGHVGFNEPSSCLASRTRVKTLTQATIDDNARFFSADEYQPHLSITMGIGTIMESKHVILLATGASKAEAIKATVEGPLSASCPASALQMHLSTTLIIDDAAATQLRDIEFYKHIERENQALLKRLGR
ncbi:glucosamine-6-phosphate deaminase [Oceanicoccus sagamiensis]|uniref:Glucosamine-6-phosphate deaminase n=1 Tax=Oceanicoccus sagamiensis TaxID=716816 RepID=A0A1X9ND65_9GAMM|nr:glucosamine-6-phosphate deaminase [Oceanicoccus sagamiensis]ARN75101.1 glucosamine-6-phosphate deaminase [Oceanicoccus sagamiensis]